MNSFDIVYYMSNYWMNSWVVWIKRMKYLMYCIHNYCNNHHRFDILESDFYIMRKKRAVLNYSFLFILHYFILYYTINYIFVKLNTEKNIHFFDFCLDFEYNKCIYISWWWDDTSRNIALFLYKHIKWQTLMNNRKQSHIKNMCLN